MLTIKGESSKASKGKNSLVSYQDTKVVQQLVPRQATVKPVLQMMVRYSQQWGSHDTITYTELFNGLARKYGRKCETNVPQEIASSVLQPSIGC